MNPKSPADRPYPLTKSSTAKIIGAVALYLLTLACASLMNEIIHDLWQSIEPNRQELLGQIADFLVD